MRLMWCCDEPPMQVSPPCQIRICALKFLCSNTLIYVYIVSTVVHVCLICGEGGHLREMLQIAGVLESESIDFFIVTVDSPSTRGMRNTILIPIKHNRLPMTIGSNILSLIHAIGIIKKESPDFIVSTGPEFAIPYFILAKMRKACCTIFVESLSRMNHPSATGRLIRFFADVYLVQWQEGLKNFPRKAEYWGRVI